MSGRPAGGEKREAGKNFIVNGPYEEPRFHWKHADGGRDHRLEPGRRDSAFTARRMVGFGRRRRPGAPLETPLELVNEIRALLRDWRAGGYAGATHVSRNLLSHWGDRGGADRRLFFCQLEAAEAMIWLAETEAGGDFMRKIPGDGGPFPRLCVKLATGAGKTVVMAMLAVWQALNRFSSPRDGRYSSDILVVTPGLTVKRRLSVLKPGARGNYYDESEFDLVPHWGRARMSQARIRVVNWHALALDKGEARSVDKRGAKSGEAWTREVLGDMADARNLVVVNDEAHHAWRARRGEADEGDQSTVWIQGLDRLRRTRGILRCYDFSATPFASSDGTVDEHSIFGWIVSDFGLNDAIEAGLVKTPRLVARDDALPGAGGVPKLRHIYPHVREELNRRGAEALPALVTQAYALLGADWVSYRDAFREKRHETPPVMISVVNDIRAAKRIESALMKNALLRGACLPEKTKRIDSAVLEGAENDREAEALRRIVDTVGQPGQPGADLEHVISVAMLSEGWDAKTVTHIMGLRAFTSQLLCEQVVGRGLRRTTYDLNEDGFLHPEYVNVFGVPFDLMLQGDPEDRSIPAAAAARTMIHPTGEKREHQLRWPQVLRVRAFFSRQLKEPDWGRVRPLIVSGADIPKHPELAPLLDGRVRMSAAEKMELRALEERFRTQTLEFEAAAAVARERADEWGGDPGALAGRPGCVRAKFYQAGGAGSSAHAAGGGKRPEAPAADWAEFRPDSGAFRGGNRVGKHRAAGGCAGRPGGSVDE